MVDVRFLCSGVVLATWVCACEPPLEADEVPDLADEEEEDPTLLPTLAMPVKQARCDAIKAEAAARGITNAVLIAGVANHETHLVQCLSEWPIHCAGPHSNDCGGPVLAGSGDGHCSLQQGGLGMFQFDAGTYGQTLAQYGNRVLSVSGNVAAGIDVIIHKLRVCQHTKAIATSDQAAIDFINRAHPGTDDYEKFLSSMASCYNGCQPHYTSCSHQGMRQKYRKGIEDLLDELGPAYWKAAGKDARDHSSERIGTNADGRLELFALSTDDAVVHRWQQQPNHAFTGGWGDLGGALGGEPVVAASRDGRLEIFAVDESGTLAHRWQTGPGKWSDAWASLGGVDSPFVGEPTVAENADGRLEVFARTEDGRLVHKWQKAPDSPFVDAWLRRGDDVVSDPAIAVNGDGRLEVFVVGSDGTLRHTWQVEPNGTWSAWGNLGGAFTSAPAVGTNADGRLEVFAVGEDGAIHHRWQRAGGSWADAWASLGGDAFEGDPVVGSNLDGRMEIVARTSDGGLLHIWQTAGNEPFADAWETFGDGVVSDPQIARHADGRLEAFVLRSDGRIWHRWQLQPNQGWSEWEAFEGMVGAF